VSPSIQEGSSLHQKSARCQVFQGLGLGLDCAHIGDGFRLGYVLHSVTGCVYDGDMPTVGACGRHAFGLGWPTLQKPGALGAGAR
jgi:hypothetical protein